MESAPFPILLLSRSPMFFLKPVWVATLAECDAFDRQQFPLATTGILQFGIIATNPGKVGDQIGLVIPILG